MASEREKVIAGLTSSSAICSEGKLAEKAYDAGYKAGLEAAAKEIMPESEACGCNDCRSLRNIQKCIRALAEGEKP